jgi:hypothetical protein
MIDKNKTKTILEQEFKTRWVKDVFGVASAKKVKYGEKKKYPLPEGKPRTVKQDGYTYTWSEETGKYE